MGNDAGSGVGQGSGLTPEQLEGLTPGDCYELVMRLALDGGLSANEAADVCAVTMLRLLDSGSLADRGLPPERGEWLLRTAIEQCSVARRLMSWRRPYLVSVNTEPPVVRA